MAGIFYGWVGLYYGNFAQMLDTWAFHYAGIQEYHLLHSNPHEYFTNIFHSNYPNGYDKFFSSDDSYWNDLKGNTFIKVLSLFDIFSFGYYYVNIIFYNFLTFFGPVAVYRIMANSFPGKKISVAIAAFLIPSFIYWTSGIHKDGLIFTGICLVVYNVYWSIKDRKVTVAKTLYILLGLIMLLMLRNFILVIIVPALIAWLLAEYYKGKGLKIFCLIYLLFGVLFFTAKFINPKFDFPDAVVTKQKEFMALTGGSEVKINQLEPTAVSFLKNLPQAISLSTVRPYPSDVTHLLSLAAAVEVNLLLLLFVISFFYKNGGTKDLNFIYFCLFFSFSTLLSIGYTVNFLGAIVRYRSITIPFLIGPLFAKINWEKIYTIFFINIKK